MAFDGHWRQGGPSRTALAALFAMGLASCTATGSGSPIELASPSFAPATGAAPSTLTATDDVATVATGTPDISTAEAAPVGDGDPGAAGVTTSDAATEAELPVAVAMLPAQRPDAAPAAPPAETAAPAAARPEEAAPARQNATPFPTANAGTVIEAGPGPQPNALAPAPVKKRGFFENLFASQPNQQKAAPPKQVVATAAPAAKPVEAKADEARPLIQLASTGGGQPRVATASLGSDLPGVRKTALFEITRKSGLDDDSDVDLHEDAAPVMLASAAGFARLAPNGLLKQTDSVDVGCLKPSLVRMLKTVEARFGKKMVVTSGFRSPERNRRARGARNSLHMYCAAADVQVPGVSKWELAKFVRSMPGRGGVGTYCHTESVHIDVGPERDWNWRCRRRKR